MLQEQLIIMYRLLLLTASSLLILQGSANPVPSVAHPFDLGVLDSCTVPTSQQLSSCDQFIDYAVPGVLLSEKILSIKHKRISAYSIMEMTHESSAGNNSQATACGQLVLRHKCKEEFPPCFTQHNTTHKMVMFTPPTPSCMSTGSNPCTYYEPSCGTTANVSLATCHLMSELTDYNYSYCSTLTSWSETYITKWMHIFLQEVEQEIAEFETGFISEAARKQCLPLYVELRCGTVGRCSHQGTRVEMNATREVCNSLMNCIGRNLKESLSKRVDCSQYPSVADKLSTDATPITQPTTVPSSMDPSTKPTEKPSQVSLATEQPTILFPDQPSRITSSAISLSLQRLSLFLSLMILCVAVIL